MAACYTSYFVGQTSNHGIVSYIESPSRSSLHRGEHRYRRPTAVLPHEPWVPIFPTIDACAEHADRMEGILKRGGHERSG